MKSYNLNIAGYIIRIESDENEFELKPSSRFIRSIVPGENHEVLVRVHPNAYLLPENAEKVFSAPVIDEINFITNNESKEFWSVYCIDSKKYFIRTVYTNMNNQSEVTLEFSLCSKEWDLWIESVAEETDPLAYPLDGLLLYYLTVINSDIMIHASGVNYRGRGYLFSGISGKGKSTMANIWKNDGAKIIHDDRLIIRRIDKEYFFFNTPVYDNDEPLNSPLSRIYLIDHGRKNKIVPVYGATAVSMVLANCIQHNWARDIIARRVESVSAMCQNIPVAELYFKPDSTIIDFILDNE